MDYLEIVKKLKPCEFKLKPYDDEDDSREHFGFIAQDINSIIPIEKYGVVDKRGDYYYVNYKEFVSILTGVVQKLVKRIEELEEKVNAL